MLAHLALALVAAQFAPAQVSVFPQGQTQTVNIVQWDGNALYPPQPVRSEQPPLSDEDLIKLTKAGFEPAELAKMVEERRCACDASADGLIRLKKAGVAKQVLASVSLNALRPNTALNLEVTLDFSGEGNRAREGYFYFFIDDGDVTRAYSAPVDELLRRRYAHEQMVDRSDLLIAQTVRRIRFTDALPLKTYGQHALMVAYSANPAIQNPSQLSPAERAKAQTYTFDYPRASVQSVCRISGLFKRDAVLPELWHFDGSQFACEWN